MAAEEKEVVYGVEVEALLYFCVRSKYYMGPCDRTDEKVKQQGHRLRQGRIPLQQPTAQR